jgi:PST family polysaccharide transporter
VKDGPDSADQWVPVEHGAEKQALQGRAARGLTWTFIDTWGSQFIQLAIFAILANLLTPADIGVVALAAVFVQFAQLFVDQGLGDALIQRKTVTRVQIDTAFWVAVATGLALMVIGIVLAVPISSLVGRPSLAPMISVLSINFLVIALSSVQLALLRREMRFRSLALRRLVAVAAGGVIGVGAAAFLNWGAWALVAQQISYGVVSVAMLWTVSPWRPGLHWNRQDFRELFGFGMNIVGSDTLNFASRNSDNLLIGAALGTEPLGFYGVGYRILDTTQTLLVNAARKLAFPVFSRIQHDRDRTRRAYGRVNRAVSTVIMPGYIGLSLVAPEAVVTLFSNKFADSGPVASTLFLIGPVLTLQVFSGALLNAAGHPGVVFRFRLITTIVHVVGFFIAVTIFKDIVAVAAAFVIGSYLLLPLNLYLQHRYAGISVFEHLWQLRWVATATAVMAAAVFAVKIALAGQLNSRALLLAVEVVVGIVVYVVALWIVERALFREVLTVALQALPGGERVAPLLRVQITTKAQRRLRREEREAAIGEASGQAMGMDVAADLGAEEPRTADI